MVIKFVRVLNSRVAKLDRIMKQISRVDYFDVDQYTDVIAFNLEDDGKQIEGEIYISIDDVLENSKLFSTSFDNEFKRVFIHGILHLIGYDDNNKKNIKIMRKLEDKYLLNCKEEILQLK